VSHAAAPPPAGRGQPKGTLRGRIKPPATPGFLPFAWLRRLLVQSFPRDCRDCYPAVFVFCLTEHRNSEKHWRQYSSHAGYALGFRFRTPGTLGLFVPQGKNGRLEADAVIRRVVYDPKLQRQMLANAVDTFMGLFSETMHRAGASARESLPAYLAPDFVENFKDLVSSIVVSIKNPFGSVDILATTQTMLAANGVMLDASSARIRHSLWPKSAWCHSHRWPWT